MINLKIFSIIVRWLAVGSSLQVYSAICGHKLDPFLTKNRHKLYNYFMAIIPGGTMTPFFMPGNVVKSEDNFFWKFTNKGKKENFKDAIFREFCTKFGSLNYFFKRPASYHFKA